MQETIYIAANKKRYPLIITSCKDKKDIEEGFIHVKCEAAKLDQEYLSEDLPLLFQDLPDMIIEELKERKNVSILLRLSGKDKQEIERLAKNRGYNNVSLYIRDSALSKF